MSLSCVAGLWAIALAAPLYADYRPPDNRTAPRGGRGAAGSRGGCSAEDGSMLLLAPRSHVGRTDSLQPTVSWFIPDTEVYEMELHLYQLDDGDGLTLIERQVMETTPGIMQASLSDDQVELTPGNQYRWRVVVICNPNRPSSALIDEAEMIVVNADVELANELESASEPSARAALYAQEGLWYDAFAQVATVDNAAGADYRQRLLQSLADIELSASSSNQTFGEQLQELLTP